MTRLGMSGDWGYPKLFFSCRVIDFLNNSVGVLLFCWLDYLSLAFAQLWLDFGFRHNFFLWFKNTNSDFTTNVM